MTIDDGSTFREVRVEYDYQENGWLREKSVRPPFDPLETLRYSYDQLGRARSMRFVSGPESEVQEQYRYNDAGNLQRFDRGFGSRRESWSYTSGSFGELGSRVDSISGTDERHTYDPIGRMTSWETRAGGWPISDGRRSRDCGRVMGERDLAYAT